MKRVWLMVLLLIFFLTGCSGAAQVSADTIEFYEQEIIKLQRELTSRNEQVEAQEIQLDALTLQILDYQQQMEELNALIDEAGPWFAIQEEERQQHLAEIEAQKAAESEADRLAREAEEKLGYNTGITYSQLARNPDDYIGVKVQFSGRVLQVMEGSSTNVLRLGVNGSYENVIYCTYSKSLVNSRILDDDYITIYGVSAGLYTYEAVLGNSITIPKVTVQHIDQ